MLVALRSYNDLEGFFFNKYFFYLICYQSITFAYICINQLKIHTMAKFITKLHLACSKKAWHQALQHVHFKDGYAYAADGYVLVKQKLEDHGFTEDDIRLVDGMAIHMESFKKVFKANLIAVRESGFECISESGESVMIPFVTDIVSPNFEAVIHKTEQVSIDGFSINPNLLSKLKDLCLNPNNVEVKLYGQNRAVMFQSYEYDEVVLIMPVINKK